MRSKLLPLNAVFLHNFGQHLFFHSAPTDSTSVALSVPPLKPSCASACLSDTRVSMLAFAACDIRHKIYMYMGCCLVHVQMAPKHTERWVTRLEILLRIQSNTAFAVSASSVWMPCIVLISDL